MLTHPSAQEYRLSILIKLKVRVIIPISLKWELRIRKASQFTQEFSSTGPHCLSWCPRDRWCPNNHCQTMGVLLLENIKVPGHVMGGDYPASGLAPLSHITQHAPPAPSLGPLLSFPGWCPQHITAPQDHALLFLVSASSEPSPSRVSLDPYGHLSPLFHSLTPERD